MVTDDWKPLLPYPCTLCEDRIIHAASPYWIIRHVRDEHPTTWEWWNLND